MSPNDRQAGHGTVTRLFHWTMAVMILSTIPVGIAMTSEGFDSIGDPLYVFHKGMGVLIGAVLALRLAWKLVTPSAPPLPDSVPPLQRRIAERTHVLLYLLLGVMVVTGYLRTVAGDFPIEILDALGIPPLIGEHPELATTLSVVHKFTAWILAVVIALHVGAAAHHALILRDGVIRRMWPPVRSGKSDSGEAT